MRAILTYHSIDASRSPISVDETAFRRHVDWLASGAVTVVPLERIQDVPDDSDAVAITFDDAFASFFELAWPLLRERRLPVTVFVPTGHTGSTNVWDPPGGAVPRFRIADESAVVRAAGEGVSVEAHTRTHPDLRRLDDAALANELAESAEWLRARTGQPCRGFAYPFGRHDARVVAAVRNCFDFACTVDFRPLNTIEDPLLLPRLDAFYFRDNDWLTRFGRASFRRYVTLRRHGRQLRAMAASAGMVA